MMISWLLIMIMECENWLGGLSQDSTLTDQRKMGKTADQGGGSSMFLRGRHITQTQEDWMRKGKLHPRNPTIATGFHRHRTCKGLSMFTSPSFADEEGREWAPLGLL
jgi:hypothetical protein